MVPAKGLRKDIRNVCLSDQSHVQLPVVLYNFLLYSTTFYLFMINKTLLLSSILKSFNPQSVESLMLIETSRADVCVCVCVKRRHQPTLQGLCSYFINPCSDSLTASLTRENKHDHFPTFTFRADALWQTSHQMYLKVVRSVPASSDFSSGEQEVDFRPRMGFCSWRWDI